MVGATKPKLLLFAVTILVRSDDLEDSTEVTLSSYLATQGVVTGSFVTMTILELASGADCPEITSLQFNPGAVICAATALDLELTKSHQSFLIRRIRGLSDAFRNADVLLNNVLHKWGQAPSSLVTAEAPQPPVYRGPSEELILWVRLQLHMKQHHEAHPSQTTFPQDFFEALKDRLTLGKHAGVLTLASILLSPTVCWQLSPFFSQPGHIFNLTIDDVVQLFRRVVHGYDFLHSDYNLYQDDRDSFLIRVIAVVKEIKGKPKLRDLMWTLFQPYASHFDYLTVTIPVPGNSESFALRRDTGSPSGCTWKSSDGRLTICWQNNWSVKYEGLPLAEKVVEKALCIPFLSCLQKGGRWRIIDKSLKVSVPDEEALKKLVVLGSSKDYVVTSDSLRADQDTHLQRQQPPPIASAAQPPSREAVQVFNVAEQRADKSELRKTLPNGKRQKVEVPESVFNLLSPFFSWDPILNVFYSLESVSVSVLQVLLERCLWLWAARNDEYDEMKEFYTSAIGSLEAYDGKYTASLADLRWKDFFEKYGCYETPRLWTLKERMVLMVACSWPLYYWDNIDQKKSAESAALRIRGMALLHPRFTQFLRSRMLEFGFINSEDFPPQFSDCSAVNICSNVCRHGLSKLGWNDFFVIDCSVSPLLFCLTGCSKELNADGLYAATSVMVNGTRVYAIVNSAMHSSLQKSFGAHYFEDYTEPLLNHPTVILVTVFADGSAPRLESVKFAFALHLQEFILMRDDVSYQRFFTVSCNHGAFISLPMSAPVLAALPFAFNVSKSSKIPSLSFDFGHCPVAVPDPIQLKQKTKQLQPLTDQEIHCDGNPNHPSFLESQDVPVPICGKTNTQIVPMYGLGVPKPPILKPSDASGGGRRKPNHSTISRSALYAVFHDTFIGVRIGRQTVYIKIHDGCCFLFSFLFQHFGVGTEKWHFRPHSYFHSKDIRHFPVESPEQFFVLLAAIKLGRMCNDPLSLAAFEIMILNTLNTYTGTAAEPLPSVFSDLNDVAVKNGIDSFYSLLIPDTAVELPVAPAPPSKQVTRQRSAPQRSISNESLLGNSDAVATSGRAQTRATVQGGAKPNFVGLGNNSRVLCPFNSLVQAWFCIQGFRNVVLLSESKDETLIELKILFYFLQIGTDCCAQEFSVSPCFSGMEHTMQQDVHEVFSLACGWLNCDPEDVNPHPRATVESFIKKHLGGMLSITRRISAPGYEQPDAVIEPFYQLSLSVRDSVDSSIASHFADEEVEFNVGTSKDVKYEAAITRISITKFPSVLHVHLKRWEKLSGRKSTRKIYDTCKFSDILKFPDRVSAVQPPTYSLQSVLVHSGTRENGHYIVYTRPDTTTDEWFCFDDQKVVRASKEEAIDANFGSKKLHTPTAYMLIYVMDTATKEVLQAPCLDLSPIKQQFLKQALDILQNISKLSASSALAEDQKSFLQLVENYVGVLTSITRAIPDPELLSKVPAACYHLQTIVDTFNTTDDRKRFSTRCESLAQFCDDKQFSLQTNSTAAHRYTAFDSTRESTCHAHSTFKSISVRPYRADFSCADALGNIVVLCDHPHVGTKSQIQVFEKGDFDQPIRAFDIGNSASKEALFGGFVLDKTGLLFVADTDNHCIRIYNCDDGSAVRVIGTEGKRGKREDQFKRPTSVALGPDGNLVVHDTGNNRLQVLRVDGSFVRTAYTKIEKTAASKPLGGGCVVFDSAGNLVFSDNDHCIRVIDYSTGDLLHKMTVHDSYICRLNIPGGLAIDNCGLLYMVHLKTNQLLVYKDWNLIHCSYIIPSTSSTVELEKFQYIWKCKDDVTDSMRVCNVAIYEDQLMYCYANTVFFCQKPNFSSAGAAEMSDVSGVVPSAATHDQKDRVVTDSDIIIVTDRSDPVPVTAPTPVAATLNAMQSAASMDQYLSDTAILMALSCFEIMAPSICGYHILFVPPLISQLIINDPESSNIPTYKNMVSTCSWCVFVTGLEGSHKTYGSHWLLHFYDITRKECFCWDPLQNKCENRSEHQRVHGPFSRFLDAEFAISSLLHQNKVQHDGLHCGVWVLLYICHFMFNGHKQLELTVDIETARRALASDFKNHRFCLDRFISCVVLPTTVMKRSPQYLPHSFWHELPVTSMENYLQLKYNQNFVLQYIGRDKYQDAQSLGECSSCVLTSRKHGLVRHYRSAATGGIVTVFHLGLLVSGESPAVLLSSMYHIALSEACGKDGSFGIIAIGSTCSWVHVCLPICPCPDGTVVPLKDVPQDFSSALTWHKIWTKPCSVPCHNRSDLGVALQKHVAWLFGSTVCDSRWNTLVFSWNLNAFKGCLPPFSKGLKSGGFKDNVGFTQPFLEMIRCKVVVVEDAATFRECLSFINSTPNISFDTERSVVEPNSKGPIDLLQVGTHDRVFLIRVNWCAPERLDDLMLALSKRDSLTHWGGQDNMKLQKLCRSHYQFKFNNVQNEYSPGNPKIGLLEAAFNEFQPYFTCPPDKKVQQRTEENWTMSGWDIPSLTPEQIGYASLDVAACNLLSRHKKQRVFKSASDYIGFLDACGNSQWHGLQKSPLVFGHFTSGKFEKGFKGQQSKLGLSIHGFQIDSSMSFRLDVQNLQLMTQGYFTLLNDRKFCCVWCSIIIDPYMSSAQKFQIVKMQEAGSCFKANGIEYACRSQQSLSDHASWLCFNAVSHLFGLAEMPQNFMSLVGDDVKGGFLRLSLSPFSQSP